MRYKEYFLTLLLILIFNTSLFSKEFKILAIGNSFSVDAVEQYLYELGKAGGDTLVIGNLAIGGASLQLHYKNAAGNLPAYTYKKIVNGETTILEKVTLEEGIKDEDWDFISVQQVSHNSGIYDTFHPYIAYLLGYIKGVAAGNDFEFAFHMIWAYAENSTHSGFAKYENNQLKMYESIVETAHKVVSELDIPLLIPSGTAIQNGRTTSLGDTFCRDGFHLELAYGRYTAACTWYEAITGKNVAGNSYKPEGMTDNQAFVARLSAHLAVANPGSVTNISGCKQ